jgi:hypothetical protein
MKLVRVGPAREERPAVPADDGTLLDLTGPADDIDGLGAQQQTLGAA